jgi:hypothetical protein
VDHWLELTKRRRREITNAEEEEDEGRDISKDERF